MELSKLYEQYGELTIQAEIINGKIQKVKKQIAQAINAKQVEKPGCEKPTSADTKTK